MKLLSEFVVLAKSSIHKMEEKEQAQEVQLFVWSENMIAFSWPLWSAISMQLITESSLKRGIIQKKKEEYTEHVGLTLKVFFRIGMWLILIENLRTHTQPEPNHSYYDDLIKLIECWFIPVTFGSRKCVKLPKLKKFIQK